MGFGCNSVGVVGCRIIDSPRERLIAVLTNSFVPCNGRFPMLIAIITMFFATGAKAGGRALSALVLSAFIVVAVAATLLASYLLSKTVLKGAPSSFTLELPPYRPPQPGKILVRSLFDRTFFVLLRAVVVAAPAGAVIWLLSNTVVGDKTILLWGRELLDPLGRLLGMDGAILMAFILGTPANEIVLPIVIMIYMSGGYLKEAQDIFMMGRLFADNGWTVTTALCTALFSLMHWPCATTLLTIRKEAGAKWVVVSVLLPALFGAAICFTVATLSRLIPPYLMT